MKREGLTVAVILLFMCLALSPSIFAIEDNKKSIQLTNGNILYVGGSGPGNYSKIQDAIDNASDDDTVFVFDDSSPYYEQLIVNKSITLIGENRETTNITGEFDGSAVIVNTPHVYISGFTISRYNTGIKVMSGGYYTNISNVVVKYCKIGVVTGCCFNNIISESVFLYNSQIAIELAIESIKTKVFKNFISNNKRGIELFYTYDCEIYSNTITNNSVGIFDNESFNYEITNNNFINNSIHASFLLQIGSSFIFLLIRLFLLKYPFFRVHLWKNNYWDDNIFGPKVIFGKGYYVSMYDYGEERLFFIDWFPASKPYHLGGGRF